MTSYYTYVPTLDWKVVVLLLLHIIIGDNRNSNIDHSLKKWGIRKIDYTKSNKNTKFTALHLKMHDACFTIIAAISQTIL